MLRKNCLVTGKNLKKIGDKKISSPCGPPLGENEVEKFLTSDQDGVNG